MNNLNEKIGKIIQQHRLKANLSQEKLAEESNLHRTYISDVERGTRNITLKSLYKIANALEIKLSDLIREAENNE